MNYTTLTSPPTHKVRGEGSKITPPSLIGKGAGGLGLFFVFAIMTQRPVPRLDLAPKLKRPLSLWNPLDYLRLLYWVFYFPQALRWYVDTFGGGYIPQEGINWRNPIQRQLLFQGVILTVVTPSILCWILQEIGVPVNWFSVAWGVAVGMTLGFIRVMDMARVVYSVALGVGFGVTLGISLGMMGGVPVGVALGVTLGMVGGVAMLEVAFNVALGVTLGVVSGVPIGVASGVVSGVVSGLLWGVGLSIAIFRLENWLSGLPFVLRSPHNRKTDLTPQPPSL